MPPAAEMASAELDAGSALERGSRCPEGERVVEGRNSGNHISLLDVDDLKRRWLAITEKAGKGRVVLRRPQKAVVGKMDPMVADLKNMAWEIIEGGMGNRRKEESRSPEKEDQGEPPVQKIQAIPVIAGQACAPERELHDQKRKPTEVWCTCTGKLWSWSRASCYAVLRLT
uniref:Uncharacterized protein n=1 Tax=Triticum urartu TaxID=4572 RepID=A0A8R7QG46_TRIUA